MSREASSLKEIYQDEPQSCTLMKQFISFFQCIGLMHFSPLGHSLLQQPLYYAVEILRLLHRYILTQSALSQNCKFLKIGKDDYLRTTFAIYDNV